MKAPWPVEALEIVGYANVLSESMLPSVVPPIFRVKEEKHRILVPPYHFNAGYLWNATGVDQPELERWKDRQKVTLFEPPIQAKAQFEMWVDEGFVVRYESWAETKEHLNAISSERAGQAERALRAGNVAEAERLATVAFSANDRNLKPLVIKAAIRRANRQREGEKLMERIAAPFVDATLFRRLVDAYDISPGAPSMLPVHQCPIAGKPGGLPGRLVDALSRQQDEMSKVAGVLHEDIGQVLTVVGLCLDVLRQDYSEKAPEIAEQTKHIQQLLEKAIEDVRQLSYKLNSDIVRRSGLRYALDTLIGRLRASSSATIRLLMDSRIHLPIEAAIAIYEIAEQAVGNAVKHSQAELIEVVLQPVQDGVRFEIRDNGVGFDTLEAEEDARGIGLIWMQHTAAKAGMKFHVVSKPGKGTNVQASYQAGDEPRREAAVGMTELQEDSWRMPSDFVGDR